MTGQRRLWINLGAQVRETRIARRWDVDELARRAGVSADVVYLIERGEPASTEAAVRVTNALGRRLEFQVVDPRRRSEATQRFADLVHSAMGELEAGRLRPFGFGVGIDEPYQHFQFAGRADVVAWDLDLRALLHLENRTRFPDIQESAGAFNAKRAYLGSALADRLGIRRWASETHVIVALWSTEILHAIRLRPETFRSLCPDQPTGFAQWWSGHPPRTGSSSELVILDPLASGKQRVWIGLDEAVRARPRHSGYGDVAGKLEIGR